VPYTRKDKAISQAQATIAKERVAKITDPADWETFTEAARVITKLVKLQLDSRIDARITRSADGKDPSRTAKPSQEHRGASPLISGKRACARSSQ
jgi:hypothetical protein